MAKAKSPKLRTLITLHALFKHADEHHRLNSVKLNDFLRPYGLECNKKVLMDTAVRLNEAGICVNLAGGGPYKGLCLTDRPLPDHELKRLIFAIETNPHITKEQAQELLDALKPAVTVYQEPMLFTSIEDIQNTPVESTHSLHLNTPLFHTYCVIHEAISKQQRVCITMTRFDVNNKEKKLFKRQKRAVTYLPRYLIENKNSFYMVAYNHARQRIEAVALKEIADIRVAQYNKLPEIPGILKMLDGVNPYDYLPEKTFIIYEGPAVFYCGAKFLQRLYDQFGEPSDLVERDDRCRLMYPVSHVTITPETLQWMGDLPDNGIRIVGPESLVAAVRNYYYHSKSSLLGLMKNT